MHIQLAVKFVEYTLVENTFTAELGTWPCACLSWKTCPSSLLVSQLLPTVTLNPNFSNFIKPA